MQGFQLQSEINQFIKCLVSPSVVSGSNDLRRPTMGNDQGQTARRHCLDHGNSEMLEFFGLGYRISSEPGPMPIARGLSIKPANLRARGIGMELYGHTLCEAHALIVHCLMRAAKPDRSSQVERPSCII